MGCAFNCLMIKLIRFMFHELFIEILIVRYQFYEGCLRFFRRLELSEKERLKLIKIKVLLNFEPKKYFTSKKF
jgi:hypothetical protein